MRAAFDEVLSRVERAKREVAEAVPAGRGPGRPLGDALAAYAADLEEAQVEMPSWRHPELESVWLACSDAIAAGQRMAAGSDAAAPPADFEALLGVVQGFIDVLEPFADAEERFWELRT